MPLFAAVSGREEPDGDEKHSALVEWALAEAQVGAVKLHGSGKDADPLLVLTAAACERYGLPAALSDEQLACRQAPLLPRPVEAATPCAVPMSTA